MTGAAIGDAPAANAPVHLHAASPRQHDLGNEQRHPADEHQTVDLDDEWPRNVSAHQTPEIGGPEPDHDEADHEERDPDVERRLRSRSRGRPRHGVCDSN
jgi:hypothetical protein